MGYMSSYPDIGKFLRPVKDKMRDELMSYLDNEIPKQVVKSIDFIKSVEGEALSNKDLKKYKKIVRQMMDKKAYEPFMTILSKHKSELDIEIKKYRAEFFKQELIQ